MIIITSHLPWLKYFLLITLNSDIWNEDGCICHTKLLVKRAGFTVWMSKRMLEFPRMDIRISTDGCGDFQMFLLTSSTGPAFLSLPSSWAAREKVFAYQKVLCMYNGMQRIKKKYVENSIIPSKIVVWNSFENISNYLCLVSKPKLWM